jgi:hypothetical protein
MPLASDGQIDVENTLSEANAAEGGEASRSEA